MKTYEETLQYLRGLAIILNDDTVKVALQLASFVFDKSLDEIWSDMYS